MDDRFVILGRDHINYFHHSLNHVYPSMQPTLTLKPTALCHFWTCECIRQASTTSKLKHRYIASHVILKTSFTSSIAPNSTRALSNSSLNTQKFVRAQEALHGRFCYFHDRNMRLPWWPDLRDFVQLHFLVYSAGLNYSYLFDDNHCHHCDQTSDSVLATVSLVDQIICCTSSTFCSWLFVLLSVICPTTHSHCIVPCST